MIAQNRRKSFIVKRLQEEELNNISYMENNLNIAKGSSQ